MNNNKNYNNHNNYCDKYKPHINYADHFIKKINKNNKCHPCDKYNNQNIYVKSNEENNHNNIENIKKSINKLSCQLVTLSDKINNMENKIIKNNEQINYYKQNISDNFNNNHICQFKNDKMIDISKIKNQVDKLKLDFQNCLPSNFSLELVFENFKSPTNVLKVHCMQNRNYFEIIGSIVLNSLSIETTYGKILFKNFNHLFNNCVLSGVINIYNEDTNHIYSGIIFPHLDNKSNNNKKIIMNKLSNRPIIPIGISFKAIISINIQIKLLNS